MATIIDQLYEDGKSLSLFLHERGEISYFNTANDHLRKALLIAAASYFEVTVREIMIKFFTAQSSDPRVHEFCRIKGMERQYHTYFDWEATNANKFFSLFGEGFKSAVAKEMRDEADLNRAVRAFLELGNLRNRLAHTSFVEKTAEEIYAMYRDAETFVLWLKGRLS